MSGRPTSEALGRQRPEVEAQVAARAESLRRAIVAGLEAMGAEVRFVPGGGDNLLRRTGGGTPPFEVVVEGLDNLVHELGHVLWLGRLEDDHGVDYGAIPYDLESSTGRRLLFEELACSVLSCSFMAHVLGEDPAEAGIGPPVIAWFAEQVGIQPVFYGYEPEEGAVFAAAVEQLWVAHGAELEACCAELHGRACRWTRGYAEDARPTCEARLTPPALEFGALWRASAPLLSPSARVAAVGSARS